MKNSTLFAFFSLVVFCLISTSSFALDVVECKNSKIKPDDGDSFFCDKEEIRMIGFDTPEIIHEQHGIFEDQPYGREAAKFTQGLMNKAKRVVYVRAGRDKYERTLALVLVDGELLGVKLIKAGLAYETISQYGDNGHPEFALQFLEAAKVAPKPKFQNPQDWRKKHQKKT